VSIVFTIFTLGCFIVVGGWFYTVGPGQARANRMSGTTRVIPGAPNPLLQTSASTKADIMHIRQAESKRLNTTGWIDEARGIVHVPIDHAIDMVASGQAPITTGRLNVPATNRGNTTDQIRTPVTNPAGIGE
jgi:hypothetical protein